MDGSINNNKHDYDDDRPIIFVTGATGFIGNRLIEILVENFQKTGNPERYKIRVISRSRESYESYPKLWRLSRTDILEIFWGPLEDKRSVLKAMQGNIVYVYHCAAKGGDWGPKQEFWKSNVTGTENVVEGALSLPNLKRFLHVSTVDVYPPNLETKFCFEGVKIPTKRRAWYSVTKALAEEIVTQAYRLHKLPITMVRPAAVFGPGSWSFGLVEAKILNKGYGVLINGGKNACGAIYVDDCVEHMIQAAHSENTVGNIYNSSAYHDKTWKMYYDAIADGIGSPRPHWSVPLWFAKTVAWSLETMHWWWDIKERPFFTLFLLGLIGRPQLWPTEASKRDFGWQPRVPFEDAMSQLSKWLNTVNLDI